MVKVWCKNERMKEEEWKRKGMLRLDVWLSRDERRKRHEAIRKMKERQASRIHN